MTIETSVLDRYSEGAKQQQESLCCPVDYDQSLLRLLPREIIEKDYGCGDPSRYIEEGDTVLDLGSGSGKICYMAAQLVGDHGKVIGVDMNDDMLALARRYQQEMAQKLGSDRVQFIKGKIQDLALDIEGVNAYLSEHPVSRAQDISTFQSWLDEQRLSHPLIEDNSIDLVVSNCVLNLIEDGDKEQLIREIFRVVKPGGRIAISDIVSDESVPHHLKKDPLLWSGCISGALQDQFFLQAFVDNGFIAVSIDKWEAEPWQVVEGIEFRAVTITAVKPEAVECLDVGHAVIYRGPFKEVYDDEDHLYPRGERIAVCERSFRLLTEGPCADQFIGIRPAAPRQPKSWCAAPGTRRSAAETKGSQHTGSHTQTGCCG